MTPAPVKKALVWDGDDGPVLVSNATREQLIEMVEWLAADIDRLMDCSRRTNEVWASLCKASR